MKCTYCGESAECMDHVVPVSYNLPGRKRVSYKKLQIVPSCNDCNLRLSNKAYHTVGKRADYLATKLAKKHKRLLGRLSWTVDELLDVDFRLRQYLLMGNVEKETALLRIEHCRQVADLNPSINDVWSQIDE